MSHNLWYNYRGQVTKKFHRKWNNYWGEVIGTHNRCDLPPIVVPLATRVLEPWTKGGAERSPEAMVLSFQVLGAGSPVSCAA